MRISNNYERNRQSRQANRNSVRQTVQTGYVLRAHKLPQRIAVSISIFLLPSSLSFTPFSPRFSSALVL